MIKLISLIKEITIKRPISNVKENKYINYLIKFYGDKSKVGEYLLDPKNKKSIKSSIQDSLSQNIDVFSPENQTDEVYKASYLGVSYNLFEIITKLYFSGYKINYAATGTKNDNVALYNESSDDEIEDAFYDIPFFYSYSYDDDDEQELKRLYYEYLTSTYGEDDRI